MDDSRREAMRKILEDASEKVERCVEKYRRRNSYLLIGALVASAVATVLAGGMAVGGPELANRFGGWRVGCALVAVFTAGATVSSGVHERLRIGQHLQNAVSCSAQIDALHFSLTVSGSPFEEVEREYKEILRKYRLYLT